MHKVIRNSITKLKLPKPSNLAPRFTPHEKPNAVIQAKINEQLSKTPLISSVINGTIVDNPYCTVPKSHYSPVYIRGDNDNVHNGPIYEANMLSHDGFRYALNQDKMINAAKHWNSIGLDKRIEHFENIASYIENNTNGCKDDLLVTTMIGQGKSLFEAEVDTVSELVDFLRFNNYYASEMNNRKTISDDSEYNFSEINGLDGFFASITPFNFTAIGANLASAPLLMGNPVIWKPSDKSLLSNKVFYDILLENNIPPELISFVVMDGEKFMDVISYMPELSGIAFTGSSNVFNGIYRNIGENINRYNNYPRLVGETGGKNFHFVHPSADPKLVAIKTWEAVTGYSGQKCSACSRLYVPRSLWSSVKEILIEHNENNKSMHPINNNDRHNHICRIARNIPTLNRHIKYVNNVLDYSLDGIHVIEASLHDEDYGYEVYSKEYFAPILSVYVYDDDKINNALDLCLDKSNNKYALTGSVFADPEDSFIEEAFDKMRFNAGNFYINDKCTGSVVGRQPFGGAGKSGTNDKAGDINLLYRFANFRSVKVNLENQ
jgi:1-pyrroline-5-carboxylate dehydrogenase